MRKVFTLGRFPAEASLAEDGEWFIKSHKGYKHTSYFALGVVTSPDDLSAFEMTIGPFHLVVCNVLQHREKEPDEKGV